LSVQSPSSRTGPPAPEASTVSTPFCRRERRQADIDLAAVGDDAVLAGAAVVAVVAFEAVAAVAGDAKRVVAAASRQLVGTRAAVQHVVALPPDRIWSPQLPPSMRCRRRHCR
jgi:hypothetical protein